MGGITFRPIMPASDVFNLLMQDLTRWAKGTRAARAAARPRLQVERLCGQWRRALYCEMVPAT